MPDDDARPADPPAADARADRPAGVRQVQGALGTSQGGAGARHAEPVLQPTGTPAPAPSDGSAPQTAENTCRRCAGTGRMPDGSACPDCAGTGRVIETVGDA